MQMTVATYNVHHCADLKGVVDLDAIAGVINEMQPDLIALQELDDGWERSDSVDQAAELARRTDLWVEFWPTFASDGRRYGFGLGAPTAFSSRYEALPGPPSEEPRGMAIAEFEHLSVLTTHLSTRIRTRWAQKKALASRARELISERPGHPLILLGDLNHRPLPWGLLRGTARGGAGLQGGHSTPTFPSHRPRRRIDHVLAGPGAQVRAQSTPETTASDHLPLVAEVVLGP